MYRRVLVPLDGSKLAECVLPHVEEIVKAGGTDDVLLVSVTERFLSHAHSSEFGDIEPLRAAVPEMFMGISEPDSDDYRVALDKQDEQAKQYLNRISERLVEKGIGGRTKVIVGNAAEEITTLAQQEGTNLIIMASHGWSGNHRWTHGSVTDKVFKASSVPVLVVRAPGHEQST